MSNGTGLREELYRPYLKDVWLEPRGSEKEEIVLQHVQPSRD